MGRWGAAGKFCHVHRFACELIVTERFYIKGLENYETS